ncbi:Peptidyl-prolyl cis-trans isomerase fkbp14 [Mactra antiquata]
MSSIVLNLLLVAVATVCVFGQDGELKVEVTFPVEKCDRKTKKHDLVTMHYVGKLENGSQFDSSMERNQPFQFQLGIGQVIKGWEDGLLDMCPGEKRRLTIPPNLAYGDKGAGDAIPPDSTLIFDVELVHTTDGPVPPNVFKQIDADNDETLTQEEVSKYLIQQALEHGQQQDENSEEHKTMIQTIFDHEDKDKDGVISKDEFSGPKHDEL